jgi:hypothetical protein
VGAKNPIRIVDLDSLRADMAARMSRGALVPLPGLRSHPVAVSAENLIRACGCRICHLDQPCLSFLDAHTDRQGTVFSAQSVALLTVGVSHL